MKNWLVIFLILSTQYSNAADIIAHTNKVKGERAFDIYNASTMRTYSYYEDDKVLVLWFEQNRFKFRVDSYDQAMTIVSRLLDETDKGLIELSYE